MKNYEMQYPVNGSTALKPQIEKHSASCEHIIIVPNWTDQETPVDATEEVIDPTSRTTKPRHALQTATPRHAAAQPGSAIIAQLRAVIKHFIASNLMQTEMVQSLLYGSAKGMSFNCMKSWQTVVVGCVFTAVAFAVLFIGK